MDNTKKGKKDNVTDLNPPEAMKERIAKSILIESRNVVSGLLYPGKTYDDLNADQKKAVQKELKGAGKSDKVLKAKGVKDSYAYGIGSEPNARNIPILAAPKLIAILNAVARKTGRTQTCVMRQVIDEMPNNYKWKDADGKEQIGFEVLESDYIVTKDGVDYDIRENIAGVYETPVKKAN